MIGSSVQGHAGKPAGADCALGPVSGRRRCPECLCAFVPRHPGQLFCAPSHRDTWNNRASVRGRVLTPLVMASRVTRNGTRGIRAVGTRASNDANRLLQQWKEEDAAAGRMPWDEYMARRYAVGFDLP